MTTYRSPAGKELIIVQENAKDNIDILILDIPNKTGTTIVKGVLATICEAKNAHTQITFVKNKKFYNVMTYKMIKDDLIKIAESLQ